MLDLNNPIPKVLSMLTVTFDNLDIANGLCLGFRLSCSGGNNNFKFTTTDSANFANATPLPIADNSIEASPTTVMWTKSQISNKTTFSSIPVTVECVSESFPSDPDLSYKVELYDALNTINYNFFSKIYEVSITDLTDIPRTLSVNTINGQISSSIESFNPDILNLSKDTFCIFETIAIKATFFKNETNTNITNFEFLINLGTTKISCSSGNIYISKLDDTDSISSFGSGLLTTKNYCIKSLNSNSPGIDVTSTPTTIRVTINNLPDDEKAKFITSNMGITFPLYVFITGIIL